MSLECERQRLVALDDLPENRNRIRQENLERLRRYDEGTWDNSWKRILEVWLPPPADTR
jgi:hypothetical protein